VEASTKSVLTTELQWERHRVFRSAAELAAIKNQLAAVRKSNRLFVEWIKHHTHHLQQSISRREITEFLSDAEKNSTLTRDSLLRSEHLRRVMALKDKQRWEQ
jgi:hypothetical protein